MAEKATKPCRYKICKGVIHSGKCPVASSRGKKGGSTTGESKVRSGSQNGKYSRIKNCGCPIRQHKVTCSKARLSAIKIQKINNHEMNYNPLSMDEYIFSQMESKINRVARKENITLKRTFENWELGNAAWIKSVPHSQFLKYDGVCSSCQKTESVISSSKIHVEDIKYRLPKEHNFKARVICNACVAQ